jgi:hypothetical protein|tara:strand:+ start:89 stop:334 length:246 start_codon:yes stop_codon:yes gene_type:complete
MTEEPSIPEQAKNITRTAYDIVKGFVFNGTIIAPDEVKKARIDICRDCNRFDPDHTRCRECGCFMPTKVKFSAARCPLKLW